MFFVASIAVMHLACYVQVLYQLIIKLKALQAPPVLNLQISSEVATKTFFTTQNLFYVKCSSTLFNDSFWFCINRSRHHFRSYHLVSNQI